MTKGHGQTEITDPVEEMLKRTGCIELHYKVQVIQFKNVPRNKYLLMYNNYRSA